MGKEKGDLSESLKPFYKDVSLKQERSGFNTGLFILLFMKRDSGVTKSRPQGHHNVLSNLAYQNVVWSISLEPIKFVESGHPRPKSESAF